MSALGPDLPPHLLAKRKRKQEEESKDEPATTSGAKRAPSPNGEKRQRVIGPAMPPAPLEERPTKPANADGSDSEDADDFGPSLPATSADSAVRADVEDQDNEKAQQAATASTAKPKRDDWMMMPPQQDDLAARLDPSKPRARGFNTGKGAKGPSTGPQDNSSWHETPEQKQKRLQDEMMGVGKADTAATPSARPARSSKDEAAAARQREQIEKSRGPSLMEQHKQSKGAEAEDDPSKRAFDRDKDMASGSRISGAQKSEMLRKAGGFSSKFSGGSYL